MSCVPYGKVTVSASFLRMLARVHCFCMPLSQALSFFFCHNGPQQNFLHM